MKDLWTSFTATAVIQICGMVSGILLARLLLPEGRGELAAVMLWPGIVASLGFIGLPDAIAYFGARDRQSLPAIATASLALAGLLSVPLMAIGAIVVSVVYDSYAPEVRETAYLYLIFIPVTLFGTFMAALFQGAIRLVEWNLIRAATPAAYAFGVAGCALAGVVSVRGFAFVYIGATLAGTIVALALAYWRGWLTLAAARGKYRPMIRYGLKVHLGFVLTFAAQRLDQALISILLAAADFGLYVVAVTLAGGAILISNTVAPVVFPKMVAQETAEGKAMVLGRYLRVTLYLFVPAGLALYLVTPWLLRILFGPAFEAAAPVTRILIAGALFLGMKGVLIAALKAYDRALIISRVELVGLIVLAGALAILVPSFGIVGAAWAQLLVGVVATIYMVVEMHRHVGVRINGLLRPRGEDWRILVAGLPWRRFGAGR